MSDLIDSFFSTQSKSEIITVGLTIPKEQENAAIDLSKYIAANNKIEYSLNKETNPPYIRLYESVFPSHNIDKVFAELEGISKEAPQFTIPWDSFETSDHNIILWGEMNEALYELHKAVLYGINHLRDGLYKQKYKDQNFLVLEDEKESLHKWGTPWAEKYKPHMVIAKSSNKFNAADFVDLKWEYKECLFMGMVVGIKKSQGGFERFTKYTFSE